MKKTERGETAAGAFSSTVFYSDHGTEVSVEKPPAADTVDFKEILKQRAADPPDLCPNLSHRGGLRRICPARPRSRTLHRKPKTAGRHCALIRGTVTEGSARSDDLRR